MSPENICFQMPSTMSFVCETMYLFMVQLQWPDEMQKAGIILYSLLLNPFPEM